MTSFIEFMIKKIKQEQKVVIHTKILNSESLQKLERIIQTGSPIRMSLFYETEAVKYLNETGIDMICKILKERSRNLLSNDDLKIINFISKSKRVDFSEFLDITGNLIYAYEVLGEMNKNRKCLSKSLVVTLTLWLYLNIYETVLKILTENILRLLIEDNNKMETQKRKKYIEYINKKIDKGEHPEAGKIEEILREFGVIPRNNSSFISKGRFFRNKLSHANLYYDEVIDKLVLSNGATYNVEYLKQEFEILLEFLLEWIYTINYRNPDIKSTLIRSFKSLGKIFRDIERSHLKRRYNSLIIEWVKEWKAESQPNSPKTTW